MLCPLCDKDKKLIESHIIPRGVWRLKGADFREVSTESLLPPKKIPKGWYQRLLCETCDRDELGPYDDYGIDFLRSSTSWTPTVFKDSAGVFTRQAYVIERFDYTKLKLFILSVLWRAAIANIEPFRDFSFSPVKIQRLKEMLLTQDPGDTQEFSTAIFKYADDGRNLHRVTASPSIKKERGNVRYAKLQLNEFECRINVSSQKDAERFETVWLSPSEPLRIIETSAERKVDEAIRLHKAQYQRHARFLESHPKAKALVNERRIESTSVRLSNLLNTELK